MKNTNKDEKIIFIKPRVLYLETGRLGFLANKIERLKDADYLILFVDDPVFNCDIEGQYPEESRSLTKVFENDSFKMYTIDNRL